MARTSKRGSTQRNSVKGKGKALHRKGSIRKLQLKPIELTPEINDLLQKVVAHNDVPKVEAYVMWSILRSLEADVDYIFQGELREEYLAKIEKATKGLKP